MREGQELNYVGSASAEFMEGFGEVAPASTGLPAVLGGAEKMLDLSRAMASAGERVYTIYLYMYVYLCTICIRFVGKYDTLNF